MFPGGWPGVGLLLLRAAVGVTAIVQGGAYWVNRDNPTVTTSVVGLLAVAGGLSLLIGFLTPVVAVLVGLIVIGSAFGWWTPPTPSLLDAMLPKVMVPTVAIAVALLGPGALSLDARLFGRREIIIPPASHPFRP